jgi:hypothetical protein
MQMIGTSLLDGIEAAIKTSPWWLPHNPVLVIEGRREVLGTYGTRYHGDTNLDGDEIPRVEPATNPGLAFSFTRRQCKAMRATLRAQAKRLASPR